MSQPESGPGALPEGHVCPEGQIWDEATNSCKPIEHETPKDPTATGEVTESLGLTKRIERTINAYFDQIEKKLDATIDKKINKIVSAKENEVEQQLRKSFGLDKDAPVHFSDLEKFGRKLRLEAAKPTTRTPASPGVAGPEGNIDASKSTPSKAIDSLMKEYEVKK